MIISRKLLYTFSLVGFFLMWGVFGFAAATPWSAPDFQATLPHAVAASMVPGTTDSGGIPVTGKTEPVLVAIVVFFGLIGLTALFLVLALLNVANRSTAPSMEHKYAPSDETHSH